MFIGNASNKDFRTEFTIPVVKSFGLHLFFIALIIGVGQVGFMERSKLFNENIQLVESSVRVDMVAMPEHTLQELRALTESASRVQETTPVAEPEAPASPPTQEVIAQDRADQLEFLKEAEDAKALEEQRKREEQERLAAKRAKEEAQAKKESEDFMAMLRQTGSQETAQVQEGRRRQIDEGLQQRLQDLVMRGNIISEGVALVGSGSGEVSSEFVAYLQRLPDAIRPHWRLPSYLAEAGLQCRVRVYLAETGRLVRAEIYETSSNDEYDRRALEAVRSASPFPKLESSFATRGARGDIVLGFPL